MTYTFFKNNKGFTLVETLVAISVLLVVIVGPMTLAQKGIQNAIHAKDQLTATYLAQEGFELIRQKRDNYALSTGGSGWFADAFGPSSPQENFCDANHTEGGGVGCNIDAHGSARRCVNVVGSVIGGVDAGCPMYQTPTPGDGGLRGLFFVRTSYAPADNRYRFRRQIVVEERTAYDVEVTVTVAWRSSSFLGSYKTVVLKGRLFDQYDNIP